VACCKNIASPSALLTSPAHPPPRPADPVGLDYFRHCDASSLGWPPTVTTVKTLSGIGLRHKRCISVIMHRFRSHLRLCQATGKTTTHSRLAAHRRHGQRVATIARTDQRWAARRLNRIGVGHASHGQRESLPPADGRLHRCRRTGTNAPLVGEPCGGGELCSGSESVAVPCRLSQEQHPCQIELVQAGVVAAGGGS
jgi:hypothetical protein